MIPFLVFLGAGLGGVARFTVTSVLEQRADDGFPWGTLLVNVCGSLIVGVLYAELNDDSPQSLARMFLGVGFCGGFTTFSAFSYETVRLLQTGELNRAALYSAVSLILALVATFAGFRIAAMIGRTM